MMKGPRDRHETAHCKSRIWNPVVLGSAQSPPWCVLRERKRSVVELSEGSCIAAVDRKESSLENDIMLRMKSLTAGDSAWVI